jgi:hypothetical protein
MQTARVRKGYKNQGLVLQVPQPVYDAIMQEW